MKESKLLYLTRAEELKANEAKRLAARGGTPVTTAPTNTILGQAVTPISNTRQVTGYKEYVDDRDKSKPPVITNVPIIKTGYQAQADFQNQQDAANQLNIMQNTTLQSNVGTGVMRDVLAYDLLSPEQQADLNTRANAPASNQYATQPQNAPTTPVQQSSTPQASFYNEYNKQTYTGAAAERGKARLAKLDPIAEEQARIDAIPTTMDEPVYDENGYLSGSRKVTNPQAVADKAAAQAALDRKAVAEAQKKQQDKATADRNAMTTARAQATNDIAMEQMIASAPPEAQGYLRAIQAGMNAIGQIPEDMTQAEFTAEQGGEIAKPYDAIQTIIDNANARVSSLQKTTEAFMKENYEKQQKLQAEQQANIEQQLVWQESKLKRDQQEINKQELDRMTISLALRGGFGSVDGNQEIATSRRKGEEALIDLQKEFGFKRTDVALAFTEMSNKAYETYTVNWLAARDNFETRLSDLDMQGISNQAAKGNAVRSAYNDYITGIKESRKELAGMLEKAATFVYGVQQDARAEQQNKEKDALSKIDYLLSNYPREEVQDAIRELAKGVTSFDASILATTDTTAARAAIAKARGGGVSGMMSGYLPSSMQTPVEPEITFDEFMDEKISELESEAFSSFSPEKRAKLIMENEENWKDQYDAVYLAGMRTMETQNTLQSITQEFGNAVVNAAQLVADGTYGGTNAIKNAAKALGVSEAAVATAVTRLRQSGEVADTQVLSPDQQKSWNGISKRLESDPYYTTYQGAKLAIGRIEAALSQKNGVSDIAAINGFQNGIVDPNATVRSDDVTLIKSAMAWADRVNLNYWKARIVNGDVLPQSMREQMAATARAVTAAYERAYAEQTLPKYQQEVTQGALPQSVLAPYQVGGQATTVSPSVSSFVDSLPF